MNSPSFSMNLADYDFDLPEELIAAFPPEKRGDDRLLVLDRGRAEPEHRHFSDLPAFLRAGDLLVLNDVRVRRARLPARKLPGGGRAALLLLRPDAAEGERLWECLIDAHRALRPGQALQLADGTLAELLAREDARGGLARVRFERPIDSAYLEQYGEVPLPPYILKRRAADPAHPFAGDGERYQTVYADQGMAMAAPTAGLHFTREMLALLERAGVRIARLTLDVGWGTFAPIRAADIREHKMHAENFTLSPQLVREVSGAKSEGRRVVAVGTTAARALESAAAEPGGALRAGRYATDIFIMPGHRFRAIDALLTNFHTPRSSLLVLVSAFAGRERVLAAYTEAVARGYRFFSYGDAMLMV